MRIEELAIGNFRSIHGKKVRLDRINVFVGSNNSGKSNLMAALRILLDPSVRTSKGDLNRKIQSQTISIEAEIRFTDTYETKNFKREVKPPYRIRGNKIRIQRKHRAGENPKYILRFGTGKEYSVPTDRLYGLGRFFRSYFKFIDLLAEESMAFESLEQVVGNIHITKTSEYIRNNFRSEILPAFDKFNRNVDRLFDQLKRRFSDQFGLPKSQLRFKVVPEVESLLSNIQLEMNQGDLDHYLRRKGQGIRNISSFIFLGMFNARRPRLVAVEEPEIHLHPSLTRRLLRSIENTRSHKQFLITTHSTNVVDYVGPEWIKRVIMRNGMTEIIAPKLREELISDFFKFVFDRHAECLLAKRVVIAEGVTEVRSLPVLSDKVRLKRGRTSVSASLNINEIQVVQVGGGAFHGPVPLLNAFDIDWVILGDGDKWPSDYMRAIEKLGMDKEHPRKYAYLKKKQSQNAKLSKEIRKTLYEYFKIICLPKRFEDLLLTADNAKAVLSILKIYLKERYNDVKRRNRGKGNLELCKIIMERRKPEWSTIVARKLSANMIPDEVLALLKLIVLRPKTGVI